MQFIDSRRNPWHTGGGDAGPVVGIQPRPTRLLDLPQWHAFRAQWPAGMPVGVTLANDVDIETLETDLPRLALIALQFPKWVDGRAYSQARLLRARYRFAGEIRATGEVLVDMLPLLKRTGFDAVVLRPDQSVDAARRALAFFPAHYQGSIDDPQPLFAKPPGTADELAHKAVPEFVSAGEGI